MLGLGKREGSILAGRACECVVCGVYVFREGRGGR